MVYFAKGFQLWVDTFILEIRILDKHKKFDENDNQVKTCLLFLSILDAIEWLHIPQLRLE